MKKVDITNFNYTGKLTLDYLHGKSALSEFYTNQPQIDAFDKQIQLKQNHFTGEQRQVLYDHLKKQYEQVNTVDAVKHNIKRLKQDNTFTVTTGHQLNLFTGPLYFIYKIITCLNMAEQLQKKYPHYHFVPVYWMASEDHDFDEIQSTYLNGKTLKWNHKSGDAVGKLSLDGLSDAIDQLAADLNSSDVAQRLIDFLKADFKDSKTYAQAFLKLVDYIFQDYGLVVLDADAAELKTLFTRAIKNELTNQHLEAKVTETSARLIQLDYKTQVNPRAINLFYLADEQRKRLIKTKNGLATEDNDKQFSQEDVLREVDEHPEKFSPNVLMRPLYQEQILPNLAYIGGGAEVAYWLQLKAYFEEENTPFPLIFLRNGGLIYDTKQAEKAKKLSLVLEDLLQNKSRIDEMVTRRFSDIQIDFEPQIKHLKQQFKSLYQLAKKTDASFEGAVAAQEKKQINGLKHLEKRLLKAEKRKRKNFLSRAHQLKNEFYPQGNLQERQLNFLQFYQYQGDDFINQLKNQFDAFENDFYLIEFQDEV